MLAFHQVIFLVGGIAFIFKAEPVVTVPVDAYLEKDRVGVALGEYVRNGDHSHSVLGVQVKGDVNHGVSARGEAHAHIVSMDGTGLGGLASYGGGVIKVGAYAEGGLKGVGLGVKATVAEVEGHIGKGPLGVGAKLGLSADTGISIGPETSFKVLGTGGGWGSKGLEVCVFGSCLYVG